MSWLTLARGAAPYAVSVAFGAALTGYAMYAVMAVERATHSKEIASLRASAAENGLAQLSAAVQRMNQAYESTEQQRKDAQDAAKLVREELVSLRTVVSGVRADVGRLPDKFTSLSRGSLEQYASTCTAIFADMAERGERLAQRCGDIAKAADGHYADDTLKSRAWFAPSPAISGNQKGEKQ